MATEWAPGPLHSQKEKSEFSSFKKCYLLLLFIVLLVGVSKYEHYTAQAQESPLDYEATNKAFFVLGRQRSGNEYVAMVTS